MGLGKGLGAGNLREMVANVCLVVFTTKLVQMSPLDCTEFPRLLNSFLEGQMILFKVFRNSASPYVAGSVAE